MKLVTIHQPDFMPWLGFFNKIAKANSFIVLDHVVNNPKASEFWGRRVKMLVGNREHWMSVTLKRTSDSIFEPISSMEIEENEVSKRKFLQTVELNYKKAPYFQEGFELVTNYFDAHHTNLMRRNMQFIKIVMAKLNIGTELYYSSELNPQGKSNEMLIDLLKRVGASTYLCGGGAAGYQNDELFNANNIHVQYNNFKHPTYPQFNNQSFIPGLSIVDAIMNIGYSNTMDLVHSR